MTIDRRKFLGGCASVCFLSGVQLSISRTALANNNKPKLLIYVFLRGGIDGLNFVAPVAGEARGIYEGYRPHIAVPRKGQPNGVIELTDDWGFNPSAASLKDIWDDNNLAIIHACGMPEGYSSRSHFDAQKYIERGVTANFSNLPFTGWLGRYLSGVPAADSAVLPASSIGTNNTESFVGYTRSVSINSLESFSPIAFDEKLYKDNYYKLINNLYKRQDTLDLSVKATMELVETLKQVNPKDYEAPSGVNYPAYSADRLKPISKDFRRVAQLLRAEPALGIHAATINVGGWDTHNRQGDDGQGNYGSQLKDLSDAISAFCQEMESVGLADRYTMVIQSEFGRRAKENNDRGTDHGTGNPLFIIGESVKGGRFYGQEPSLLSSDLFQQEDIAVTTDYRKVLRETLGKDFNVEGVDLNYIFPGYNDTSDLGIFDGEITPGEKPPVKEGIIFANSFE